MLTLQQMSREEYTNYLSNAVIDYAADKITAGTWTKDEAIGLANDAFADLLPQGIDTPNEYLYTIHRSNIPIGHIWLHYKDQAAFIYDFLIIADYRNKGYGSEAMTCLEQRAKQIGAVKLSLHVFAHNKQAVHVYEKAGFQYTDHTMAKNI
ncbi:Uncharacterized N-acetyltransferase YycN [Listeria grayi]|uniref:Histone acetyltransferase HPA2 n=1 Tax=Listeria grayi FSL F6-1183 TaxID=1265827 RepID=A0A829RA23_LISGR|nr:GNAT family N-acetyltransferase [Listeria grayi]EUJ29978.1 histone acetyltransferase HPA2 [Listeria grayi FSL F6-1183]VEI34050.1 Uncharacterized N-acetyltransferase YycN [Listeria grayi]